VVVGLGLVEDSWVGLGQLLDDFLAVLDLHQRGLHALNCHQEFFFEKLVAHRPEGSLQDVVAELVVDQFLDNKGSSGFGVLAFGAKFLQNLAVVLLEGAFENLFEVAALSALAGFDALFDDIAGELELAEPDEVLGDLADDSFVFVLVVELEHVLDEIVAVGVFNELDLVFNNEVGQH